MKKGDGLMLSQGYSSLTPHLPEWEMKRVLEIIRRRMDVVTAKRMAMAETYRYTNMLMWDKVLEELDSIREEVSALEETERQQKGV